MTPRNSLKAQTASSGQRTPLHATECRLLLVLCVLLCFLPWALGTMHRWSQIISLAISLVAFLIALSPRTYAGELVGDGAPFRIEPWFKLVHFPIFWIGLGMLAYIGMQIANPSWQYSRSETQWWLVRIKNVPWLPTGME